MQHIQKRSEYYHNGGLHPGMDPADQSYRAAKNQMKAAIYCRLSEEDRNKLSETDDSGSIANQKSLLVSYASEQGWEVYDIYSDDDYAGADRRRPAFNRLLTDAEAHKFDIVLCKTQSRFTRELELVETYIHGLFPLWGIRFVSIVDNADTANKGNKKSRQINGLVNEWYLEDMSDNIRSVLTNKRMNGQHIGAFALYGYQKDPAQKGHLLIDKEAAGVVQQIFKWFCQGYGKTAIARMLNEQAIPNPTAYKRLQGLHYRQPATPNSTLWRYDTISKILSNEMYIGNMVQGRYGSISYKTKQNKPRPKEQWYIVTGTHEPIIDEALWEQVKEQIQSRARPCCTGQIGIFAGKVRCGNCGYSMRSTKSRGKTYLQCATRHISKNACTGAFISAEYLEEQILYQLKEFTKDFLDMDLLQRSITLSQDLKQQKQRLELQVASHNKKVSTYTAAIRKLYLDKVDGLITEEDYMAMMQDFSRERKRQVQTAAEKENALKALEFQLAHGDELHKIADQYVHTSKLSREMVETFIDHITIEHRIPGTHRVPIQIHWKF